MSMSKRSRKEIQQLDKQIAVFISEKMRSKIQICNQFDISRSQVEMALLRIKRDFPNRYFVKIKKGADRNGYSVRVFGIDDGVNENVLNLWLYPNRLTCAGDLS